MPLSLLFFVSLFFIGGWAYHIMKLRLDILVGELESQRRDIQIFESNCHDLRIKVKRLESALENKQDKMVAVRV